MSRNVEVALELGGGEKPEEFLICIIGKAYTALNRLLVEVDVKGASGEDSGGGKEQGEKALENTRIIRNRMLVGI